VAFIITRVGDIWSTSLFMLQPGGEASEMNPLSSVLGFGFWPVFTVNILLSALLLLGHWHYYRHFEERPLPSEPSTLSDYISLLFFGRTGQAWKALLTTERHTRLHNTLIAHAMVKAMVFVGALAVMHNLGQFHGWALNDHLRTILVRPSLVYYGSTLPLAIFFACRTLRREFVWRKGASIAAG
jgi:hypothetical protein